MAELVAGNSQDNKTLAGVPVMELVHLGVIPGGRTSERRDILNEHHFALQRGELKGFPRQQIGCDVVKFRRHSYASFLNYSLKTCESLSYVSGLI